MVEFTQEEALFILELGWAKIFERVGIEDGIYIATKVSVSFDKPFVEQQALEVPISRIIESNSLKGAE